jgi:hypothetical protein
LLRLKLRIYGVKPATVTRRTLFSPSALVREIIKAMLPVVMAIVGTAALLLSINISPVGYLSVQAVFLGILLVSTAIHEIVHWWLLEGERIPCIVRQGLRIGLLHEPQSQPREVLSALAGPLAGAASAWLLAALLHLIAGIPYAAVALLAGVFHLFSWLPSFGDGQALRQTWRLRHA